MKPATQDRSALAAGLQLGGPSGRDARPVMAALERARPQLDSACVSDHSASVVRVGIQALDIASGLVHALGAMQSLSFF